MLFDNLTDSIFKDNAKIDRTLALSVPVKEVVKTIVHKGIEIFCYDEVDVNKSYIIGVVARKSYHRGPCDDTYCVGIDPDTCDTIFEFRLQSDIYTIADVITSFVTSYVPESVISVLRHDGLSDVFLDVIRSSGPRPVRIFCSHPNIPRRYGIPGTIFDMRAMCHLGNVMLQQNLTSFPGPINIVADNTIGYADDRYKAYLTAVLSYYIQNTTTLPVL